VVALVCLPAVVSWTPHVEADVPPAIRLWECRAFQFAWVSDRQRCCSEVAPGERLASWYRLAAAGRLPAVDDSILPVSKRRLS
jgi:hypothetical protein